MSPLASCLLLLHNALPQQPLRSCACLHDCALDSSCVLVLDASTSNTASFPASRAFQTSLIWRHCSHCHFPWFLTSPCTWLCSPDQPVFLLFLIWAFLLSPLCSFCSLLLECPLAAFSCSTPQWSLSQFYTDLASLWGNRGAHFHDWALEYLNVL